MTSSRRAERRTVTVGVVQLTAAHGDVAANLDAIEELAAAAAADGARVVVTPELALTGYLWPDEDAVRGLAEPVDGPSVRRLAKLCRSTGTWLVLGLPELDPGLGTLHNTCVLVGPDGPAGAYRKAHSFVADPLWAVDGHAPPPVWDTPAGRVAPLICADADYPETARYAALAGADWVALPTAWVFEPGPSAVWRLRAWENGLPLVAADQAGAERLGARTVQFAGGSCVLDHTGTVLAALDDGPGHRTATLDLDAAAAARRARLAARRPAEYRPLARATVWPRPDRDALLGAAARSGDLTLAVLSASPIRPGTAAAPPPPEGTGLAVLPAFHLTGGVPEAARAGRAVDGLREWCAEHGCEAVTALAVPADGGAARYAVVLVGAAGEIARREVTHLGAHAAWAEPGEEGPRTVARPWGSLGLLAGEELEPFEPSRALAVLGADVLAVPAAVDWPFPVPFAGTRVPLNPAELRAPQEVFAHPARLRAGDSHVWVAMANAGPVPGGVFSPDAVTVPRGEALARGEGWASLRADLGGAAGPGAACAAKPQLARRRTDLFGAAMLRR
ncbi:amidohydrolase [Microtetraspora sp. NBRC 13810]|uniref:nitrilase-related carbon-nitrogen hydrolase n=1 Tax=Microtetraspora sp. NBRC 13810 TaxID=3030990 RepID=UPI0024A1BA67|nr:nitrilase-related carbon-nitrogen hydrolase [Microtetraspora sp. NBRC 13810]GLW10902.1 amidohydrolase [Microtetraspora sp. NBRC 13810]